jgi:hypothetical protein
MALMGGLYLARREVLILGRRFLRESGPTHLRGFPARTGSGWAVSWRDVAEMSRAPGRSCTAGPDGRAACPRDVPGRASRRPQLFVVDYRIEAEISSPLDAEIATDHGDKLHGSIDGSPGVVTRDIGRGIVVRRLPRSERVE